MLNKSKIKISSNRSFGIVFFTVFIIIGLWPLLNDNQIRVWSILIGTIFLVLGLMKSNLLTPLNKIWFKFGLILGSIISPIVMGLVFFMIVTPTSYLMKLLNKDLLNNKFDEKRNSYWINKSDEKNKSTMKQQF
jgi:uncharacterized protein YacL